MLTLALIAALFTGDCDTTRARNTMAAWYGPSVGAVIELGWELDTAERLRTVQGLKATGRGLRYLDIGAGYNTYTVVLAKDADPTDELVSE